jgi:hypothetical protein
MVHENKCTFKQEYYDFKTEKDEIFECKEPIKDKKFCLFHEEAYIKDISHPENKDTVITKLHERMDEYNNRNEILLCIGYYLPDVEITKEFKQPIYFNNCKFQNVDFSHTTFSGQANFSYATFSGQAYFHDTTFSDLAYFSYATFSGKAYFSDTTFSGQANFHDTTFSGQANFTNATFSNKTRFLGWFKGITKFNYITFEIPNKVIFEVEDMSKVSFINTDITGIRFSDKTSWGGKDKFHVIEEKWLDDKTIKERERPTLGGILSVYRNLRENYELRRRYDEAGKFFIREMELKRMYREVISGYTPDYKEEISEIKKNCWFRRNFSLTGIYHNISSYGESLWRPTLVGCIIVILASFFFACQSNPYLAPSISSNPTVINTNSNKPISAITNIHSPITTNSNTSSFIGLKKIGDGNQWLKASERSVADFIPLLPSSSDIKIGLIDYLIKIVGGAVTFGLIAIALRRRFERKYTH